MKNRAAPVIRVIAAALACLLLLCSAAAYIPALFGVGIYAVVTGSMGSALPEGTLAYTGPCAFDEVAIGDILCFYDEEAGMAFTHRVVGIDAQTQTFRTRGDANNTNDPTPTPYRYMRGRVEFSLPLLGWVSIVMRTWWGVAAAAAIMLAFTAAEIVIIKRRRS